MKASTLSKSQKEDCYFCESGNNLPHALTIGMRTTTSKQHFRKPKAKLISQTNLIHLLKFSKSVHHNVAIRVNNQNPLHTDGLLDSGSKANLVSQKVVKQLNLPTPTITTISNIKLMIIDGRRMQTYGVHQLNFEVTDRLGHTRYFKDSFLACDCENPLVLGMPWLTLANLNIHWLPVDKIPGHIEWKQYNASVALETTRRITTTDAEDFAKEAMAGADNVYVMHVKHISDPVADMRLGTPSATTVTSMNLKQKAFDNSAVIVPDEYQSFSDVFSDNKTNVLPPHGPDDHAIDLIDNRQPLYSPVYNLSEVELTVLRQYIDKHLANQFIRPSKLPAEAPILFVKKPSGGLRLCVDYQGLNNITIKNRYPLSLIGESLDRLGRAKRFT